MASLNTGLNTALSGLSASQTALGVTAHNISNAATDGYSRQMVDLQAVNVNTGAYQWKPVVPFVGNGVNSNQITQARDGFLDVRYRTANAQYSDYEQRQNDLGQVEDIFNEVSTSGNDTLQGLSGQLNTLINDIGSYQSSPASSSLPVTIKTDAENLVTKIRTAYSSLTTFESQEQSALNVVVSGDTQSGGINGILQNISTLNTQIVSMEVGGQPANDLRDQRNQLLDKLSGYLDISATEQSDGSVTVQMENDLASGSGAMLVDGNNIVHTLKVVTDGPTDASGLSTTAVTWDASDSNNQSTTYATNTGTGWSGNTLSVGGGSVNGYLAILNGDGSGTGSYGDVGVHYLKEHLNDFAQSFADIMNSTSTSSGGGAQMLTYGSGTPPTPTYPDTTGWSDPTASAAYVATDAAATISLSDAWNKDDTLFGDNYTGTSVGTYAQAFLNALGSAQVSSYDTSAHKTLYTDGTMASYAATFSNKIANVINDDTTMAGNYQIQKNDLDTQRQSVSSVSIDEETVNLMKFQQMYGASARVITTINDMMGTLLSMAQ
ncbi:flagellar hook-associated protein FlgK [Ethanoligenens harbinense]|uniref:Flagellar hook-associated protein 1 n=1 Tax=Ethanoligenens harbinense (strain DSM 18485 / JCM 12961 / CGMCC 1.5033 / YUAN-3) TaxID=663278 RepID=E6U6H6_ETHHY|nr:flagellar hook-associated protein FlgK [Ethanoligenens harbinense]ADU28046.1 flagellar hook-associated protein FlgK [Ethanoligenens harbinense YUAN-3]AVQ97063.1 flagellar hook-associated protein FlgK [Ethanoligenens harbinense YUAN-3]AYF39725.1 flagellar hook-associated protein FlgK [Ethanoligenens harbinense]AYF42558.1 flagellar hook-associated protein FlgK [Ethanoligenens harbinense]QCN93306.1 flagellar hook-associated protein FlgK [Ethanoligenens harbinense]